MKNILCYGDSNTYGLSPDWIYGTLSRHDSNTRWPGRLQALLGSEYYVIEEGLNGRTTVFDDPTMYGRNGFRHLQVCLESHSPLDLVILMLGTNDTKDIYNASPMEISAGIGRLVKTVLNPFTYVLGAPPAILIAAPVPLGEESGKMPDGSTDFTAIEKSRGLAGPYSQIAEMYGCDFIDLAPIATAAPGEGVHLNAQAHSAVADAMHPKVLDILGR